MDSELIRELTNFAAERPAVSVLAQNEADELRLRVANRFGFKDGQVWWWDNLPHGVRSLSYAAEAGGLSQLARMLPETGAPLFLFVTDDEPPPWPCIVGPGPALAEMLGSQRFFEYFIVNGDAEWILFDTHHNALLSLGNGLRLVD